MRRTLLGLALVWLTLVASDAYAADLAVTLGQSVAALNGPWKFQTGDDPRWAASDFDDSSWASVALTPSPGATDGDVGIPNYVPGWTAKGYPGYQGYAWYRTRLTVRAPASEPLALLGPWAVDSSYQVYVNGSLVGGVGDFSGAAPTAYGYHYPRMFDLPSGPGVIAIAIRAWMGPWGVTQPGSGGIHVAPAIGVQNAVAAQYRLQWLKIFEGYAVDAVLALLFFLAAIMVLCLRPFDRSDKAYAWLPLALILSGVQRGNQAFFFWWRIETIQEFVIFIIAVAGSLSFSTWMMAWRSWFKLDRRDRLPWAIGALTLTLMFAQLFARPWLVGLALPHAVTAGLQDLIKAVRLAFLLVLALIVYRGLRQVGREGWYALPAVLAIGAVLFTAELASIHVRGIWFPWGVGLSLSEASSVIFVVLLFLPLLRRLWSYAAERRPFRGGRADLQTANLL